MTTPTTTTYAIMRHRVTMAGVCGMALESGQRVSLIPASNLPGGGYFARPANNRWSDGVRRNQEDSILLDGSEFMTEEPTQ